jgi:glycosyltransferase involved in cell wall biosynthesis
MVSRAMVSFVVIGRNVEQTIDRCLDSIEQLIKAESLSSYEVIYVDSLSTDTSLKKALKHGVNLKVFQLTKDKNAAIARNMGASCSEGEYLFFLDGDMELIPDQLKGVFDDSLYVEHPFISFSCQDVLIDQKKQLSQNNLLINKDETRLEGVTGGLFFISKKLWGSVNGMRPKYLKSQDIDLGLRLSKLGNSPFYYGVGAFHHTVPYLDKRRKWKELYKHLYGRSLLYRDHFPSLLVLKRMLMMDYSLLILIIVLILIGPLLSFLYALVIYLLIIAYRSKKNISAFFFFIVRDLVVLVGLFFFYPKKKFEIEFLEIDDVHE